MGIALLVAGDDMDLKVSSERPKKLSKAVQQELVFGAYLILTQLCATKSDGHNPKMLKELVDKVGAMSLGFLQSVTPLIIPHLRRYRLDTFPHVAHDFAPLFSRKFTKFWKMWFWVFRSSDPMRTFSAFEAAVTLLVLPEIEQFQLVDPTGVLGRWDDLSKKVTLPGALNLANYLLMKQRRESP